MLLDLRKLIINEQEQINILIMRKITLFTLVILVSLLTSCNTPPYERAITNHYRNTGFTADLTLIKDYKPISVGELKLFTPQNGYYFQIQPDYYTVHTYKCTLRLTAIFKTIENYTQTDTVYLYKTPNGYEVCRRYSLNNR